MSRDTSALSDDNLFKGKASLDACILEIIRDLTLIRATLDSVPGMPFITESDKNAIMSRIGGYLTKLSTDIGEYLEVPDVQ